MGAVRTAQCERARLWVSLALDGELSEIEEAALRVHVGSCAACAGFELDVVALTKELRSAPLVRPAAEAVAPRRRRSPTVRVLQLSAAAAAVVLAAGLGTLVGSLSSRSVPTATTERTGSGGTRGAGLDPGIVAMLPAQRLPASYSRRSFPI
jgi:predicted anti-sigma-YlaC factor YlaD